MRIDGITLQPGGLGSRITARLHWEDVDREPFSLDIETGGDTAPCADQVGNALLTAVFPIAFHDRERRIAIDALVCPMLADNLHTVVGWWAKWASENRAMAVEFHPGPELALQEGPATAFLSGGVDSFHMLHRNRKLYSPGSSAAIATAIIVHGFDIGRRKANPENELFDLIRARIEQTAAARQVAIACCRTNLRHIKHTPGFWFDRYFGAAAIAMGHAVAPGHGYLMLAGSFDIASLAPIGSHPAVDVQFSSQRLSVLHEGSRFTRLQKIRELREWPQAIDNLRVCGSAGRTAYNCGVCEKCIRTRLELLAAGCQHSQSLGPSAVDASAIDPVVISNHYQLVCYREIADALRDGPNAALARAIDRRIEVFVSSPADGPGT